MRPLPHIGWLTLVSAIVLVIGPGVRSQAPAIVPSFNADVAPVIFEKCAGCHRPGEVAPMSLLTYADTRPWARAIKQKVLAREMPPWFADPQVGTFRNQRGLTTAQIDTLVAWVDAGAPEGTRAAAHGAEVPVAIVRVHGPASGLRVPDAGRARDTRAGRAALHQALDEATFRA